MRSRPLLLALPFSVLSLACDGSGGEPAPPAVATSAAAAPADVARAFLAAAEDGDEERFQELLTAKALDGLNAGGGGFELGENLESYAVEDARIDGDEARVPVHATLQGGEQDMSLRMRREGDDWRIWGFDVVLGEEAPMTIDLESMGDMLQQMGDGLSTAMQGAFEEAARGGSEEEIREARMRFQNVAAISEERHEAAWKIDVESGGEPASEVLSTILEGTGMTLDGSGCAGALAQPVEFSLAGVSRLEALERVCEEIGVHPVYPEPNGWGETEGIRLQAGPRARPIAFAGPFLVEIPELEETPPHSTGSMTFAVRGLGLAPQVLAFQTDMVELFAADEITDVAGRSVMAQEGVQFFGTPAVDGAYLSDRTSVDLRGLLRTVTELSAKGVVKVAIPTTVDAARWKASDKRVKSIGGWSVVLQEWGESTRFELAGAGDLEKVAVRLSALDAEMKPMGVLFTDSSAWQRQLQATIQTPEEPATIDLKVCDVAEVSYPFTIRGIPLARYDQQPERLEPLSFDGDAPLTVDFVRFTERGDFPKVELRLFNSSNKEAVSAQATFVYFDGNGIELESFPHSLSGEFSFDGTQPLARAGATTTQEAVAFFVPPRTASITVRVDAVSFADASQWER